MAKVHIKCQNKTNVCAFIVGAWCKIGKEELQEDQTRVIAGGFGDNEKVLLVRTQEAIEIAALYSGHEEAVRRLLLLILMFWYYAVLNSLHLVVTNCGSTLALVIKHGTSKYILSACR